MCMCALQLNQEIIPRDLDADKPKDHGREWKVEIRLVFEAMARRDGAENTAGSLKPV
jgi:hypothetical protein